MLKKVGIAMLIVASLGMAVTRNKSKVGKVQKTVKENNQANTKLSSEDKEAINTAINFMNEYIISLYHLFLCPIYFESSINHFPFCFTSFNVISVPP